MDAREMAFADASFYTVCISNSLHHMADLERVLAEMARVLRPKGRFIVAEMYCDGQTGRADDTRPAPSLVGAAAVEVHRVEEPEPGIGLLHARQEDLGLDLADPHAGMVRGRPCREKRVRRGKEPP